MIIIPNHTKPRQRQGLIVALRSLQLHMGQLSAQGQKAQQEAAQEDRFIGDLV
jgi:hypothetical protein